MKRVMLTVAYEGTNYHGWQREPTGITIEEVLNRELSRLLGEEILVSGASRTDAGVHALGNLCVLDTESPIPPEKIAPALLGRMPEDIVVTRSEEVAPDFHPRRCDSVKCYEYTIYRGRFPNPLCRRTSLHFYRPLEPALMQQAGAFLVGEHDFKSFCAAGSQAESTVRRILSLQVTEDSAFLRIQVRGTGFLYNMVRIIAGTLIQAGLGRLDPLALPGILEGKNRELAGPTAPPEGLCLMGIELFPEGFPPGLLGKGDQYGSQEKALSQ
ncbi:MAG: tRNA pseudouridine(38-40) synthase TruA [Lachnospiraceae bacterium]|nr:tRNA pseudouridine(38-40) synthase TruA [Lachnospiraceae bacterium]